MSRIHSKNTQLDLAMKAALRKEGIRFKMYPRILGTPDFLLGNRTAVFCDSSFWHGRNWEKLRKQLRNGSNSDYWISHISRNKARDRAVNAGLRRMGYTVLRFWDVSVFKHPEACVTKIKESLREISRRREKCRSPRWR
jgi:DNA mismatch endonuclease (patch repair protein)